MQSICRVWQRFKATTLRVTVKFFFVSVGAVIAHPDLCVCCICRSIKLDCGCRIVYGGGGTPTWIEQRHAHRQRRAAFSRRRAGFQQGLAQQHVQRGQPAVGEEKFVC